MKTISQEQANGPYTQETEKDFPSPYVCICPLLSQEAQDILLDSIRIVCKEKGVVLTSSQGSNTKKRGELDKALKQRNTTDSTTNLTPSSCIYQLYVLGQVIQSLTF